MKVEVNLNLKDNLGLKSFTNHFNTVKVLFQALIVRSFDQSYRRIAITGKCLKSVGVSQCEGNIGFWNSLLPQYLILVIGGVADNLLHPAGRSGVDCAAEQLSMSCKTCFCSILVAHRTHRI